MLDFLKGRCFITIDIIIRQKFNNNVYFPECMNKGIQRNSMGRIFLTAYEY